VNQLTTETKAKHMYQKQVPLRI